MKRFLPIILPLLCGAMPLMAGDPSEQFLNAYQSYQQGEKLERGENTEEALAKYRFAESLLTEVSRNDPTWQKPVVEYRLKKTRENIERLQGASPSVAAQVAAGGEEAKPDALPAPAGPSITIVPPSGSPGTAQASATVSGSELKRLRRQLDDLKSELQEARSALSSRKRREGDLESAEWVKKRSEMSAELDMARRRISDLERDLKARASWQKDLRDLQKKLDDTVADKLAADEQFQQTIRSNEAKNAELLAKLREAQEKLAGSSDSGAQLAKLRAEAEAGRQSVEQLRARLENSERLAKDALNRNSSLRADLAVIEEEKSKEGQNAAVLAQQVGALRQQIAVNEKAYGDAQRQLAELSKLQPEQEKLLKEKDAALSAARAEAGKLQNEIAEANRRIAEFRKQAQEGDDRFRKLQDQLAAKDQEIARIKAKQGASSSDEKTVAENELLRGIVLREIKEEAKRAQARRLVQEELKHLNIQSQSLAEQLTVLSVPSMQLTPQERALFKDAQLAVAEPAAEASPKSEKLEAAVAAPLSAQATESNAPSQKMEEKQTSDARLKELLTRAKAEFEKQDFLHAESTFQEALKISPDDYFALSNLGVVQFQLGKMKDAEESLRKASEKSKDNSFALTTLGIVHYRQQRLPDAEAVLRKALAINQQDFTAHNYLGIVLAASGNGKAGESEIMRAIEINPQYADAHFNMAVIYATGKPPSKMMAKKHYRKAVDLGAPPDASLEQLIQ